MRYVHLFLTTVIVLCLCVATTLLLVHTSVPGFLSRNVASVFMVESKPQAELKATYTRPDDLIHILVVPGHEPDFGGTQYDNHTERDMAVELARSLVAYLRQDPHFEVTVTRDEKNWNPVFAQYFATHATATKEFYDEKSSIMNRLIASGTVESVVGVSHNSAPPGVSDRLYGMNMWVNEHDIDLVINIHFNDTPRKDTSVPGLYNGFTIYVPEHQYSNSSSSKVIGNAVFNRLQTVMPVSNLPKEDAGVVEDQELIAIGRYNTLNAPSLLIEYGYIYEPQFKDATSRSNILKELAYETALGFEDFFTPTSTHIYNATAADLIDAVRRY
jgi:N-acetylmuramoyl-L-alanine amidase